MLDQKWLTIGEAAEVIGCTPDNVRLLVRQEKIDGQKIGLRNWILSKDSVEKFASKQQRTGRPRKNKKIG